MSSNYLVEYNAFIKVNDHLDVPYMCNDIIYDNLIKDLLAFKPKNSYEFLSQQLLRIVLIPSLKNEYKYNFHETILGFTFQRNYGGLMTDRGNKNRPKRGLFDFKINVNENYNMTHYQLFCEILKYSSLESCKRVLLGEYPNQITSNTSEFLVLHKLMLFMFEQEVNWGDETFQELSAFAPSNKGEPRDMLMGFIDMLYNNQTYGGVNNIPDWKLNKYNAEKTTPIFGKENKYSKYDVQLKRKHFQIYRGKGNALMVGEIRSLFLRTANLFKPNF